MKTLEVTIEKAEFSDSGSYRISFQGQITTDSSADTATPTFVNNVLRIPFAVKRNGLEYLNVTIHRTVVKNNTHVILDSVLDTSSNKSDEGEAEELVVGNDSLEIHPGTDVKNLIMEVPKKGDEEGTVTGTLNLSYKIITLSVVHSIQGDKGAVGLSINSKFVGVPPLDLNLRILDSPLNSHTIAAGKLSGMKSFTFMEMKPTFIKGRDFIYLAVSGGERNTYTFPVRCNGPNTFTLSLGQGKASVSSKGGEVGSPPKAGHVVLTILVLKGTGYASAVLHDCYCSLPFAFQGVLHVEQFDNTPPDKYQQQITSELSDKPENVDMLEDVGGEKSMAPSFDMEVTTGNIALPHGGINGTTDLMATTPRYCIDVDDFVLEEVLMCMYMDEQELIPRGT